jgi:serine phosphatase RsbU (regulator of sigma subunit)
MKKLACIFFLLLQVASVAQLRHKLDSLLLLTRSHAADTALADIYNNIGYQYTRIDADSSELFSSKGRELSQSLNYKRGLGDAYNNIGINYYIRGAYAEAEKQFLLSKKIAEELRDTRSVLNRQSNLGIIYYAQGRYAEALSNYSSTLRAHQQAKDTLGMARSLDYMASVYIQLADYDKALNSYLKALDFYEKKGDKSGMTQVYNNIGIVYNNLDNYAKAIENYEACVRISKQIGDRYRLTPVYNNLGKIYQKQGDREKAVWHFNESLRLSREMHNTPGIAYNLVDLGTLAQEKKDYSTALRYYQEALQIHETNNEQYSVANTLTAVAAVKLQLGQLAEASQALEKALRIAGNLKAKNTLAECYTQLALLYKKQNNFKRSLEYLERYAEMRDTILNDDKNKNMAEMQARFDTDKKEKEIALLTKNKNIEELRLGEQEANLEKQRVTIYASLGGITLALALAFFVMRGYSEKKKANALLEEKNEAISQQKQLLEEKNVLITDSIEYARNIQEAILPDPENFRAQFKDSFVFFRPKDVVSGDFYWLRRTDANEILLAAIDCVGHGVPGAFMALHSYNLLERISKERPGARPADMLDTLNKNVLESLNQQHETASAKHGMDLALIRIDGNSVHYAGARNPLIIVGREYREIKADAMYIGGAQGSFTNHTLQAEPGDMLYLYTDGYPDQKGGPQHKKFFVSEFKKLLQTIAGKSCQEQEQLLRDTFQRWKGDGEQIDDVLVIGVRI